MVDVPSTVDLARLEPALDEPGRRRGCPSGVEVSYGDQALGEDGSSTAAKDRRRRRDAARIVLFGATGYTGDLTARELVRRGRRPVLAARNAERLAALADELGGLRVADRRRRRPDERARARGARRRARLDRRAVPALGRAGRWRPRSARARTTSTRRARARSSAGVRASSARAQAARLGLLTAIGYDWVPGNLAGALALRDAGPEARRAWRSATSRPAASAPDGMSGGTRASAAGMAIEPGFTCRSGGRVVTERGARRGALVRALPGPRARRRSRVGSTEHFTLPRAAPRAARGRRRTSAGSARPRAPLQVFSAGDVGRHEGPGRQGRHPGARSGASSRARPAGPTPPRASSPAR